MTFPATERIKRAARGGMGVVIALLFSSCGTPATPPRPGGVPIDGEPGDVRPDPVVDHLPLIRGDARDRSIAAAVSRGLAEASRPRAATIQVAVADGKVTLSGLVASARQRRAAGEVAAAVAGVVAVDNQLRIEPVVADDETVARGVREALADAFVDRPIPIEVAVRRGEVVLGGVVPSFAARELAAERAAEVSGVLDVRNELRVAFPEHDVADAALRTEVKDRIARLAADLAPRVEVTVQDGVVTLSGEVPTFALRRSLIARAAPPGAREVKANELRVAWRVPVPETGLASGPAGGLQRRVTDEIAADPSLADLPIEVVIAERAGRRAAILRGAVPTVGAERTAIAAATATPGIDRVESELVVTPKVASDAELAARVLRAFVRDPYLDSRTIVVRVADGRVHLTGTVDAPFERERAEVLASRLAGVREIINALTVVASGARR
jgi:hyperosmotically inducible periplasmic protein